MQRAFSNGDKALIKTFLSLKMQFAKNTGKILKQTLKFADKQKQGRTGTRY